MGGRVTNLRTTDILIQQIFDRRTSLEQVRQEISSGTKVAYGSEDPGKTGTILSLQAASGRIERHKERITFATGLLDHQEATLDSADEILVRAKELATQGANESLSFQDRRLLADEVIQLRDQMVSLANTTYQGRYIYGAADDGQAPFTNVGYAQAPTDPADPAAQRFIYNADGSLGATQTRNVEITDDDSIRVVSRGDNVFAASIGALERLGRALDGYRTTLDGTTGLPNGQGTAYTQPTDYHEQTHDIQTALDALDTARTDDIIVERSDVGARMNRLQNVTAILDNLKASTEASRASLQDADIFESSANFAGLQTALQALLASSAQINNLSLINYI